LKARTSAALDWLGLTHAPGKLPGEISGGMKQRVGIAARWRWSRSAAEWTSPSRARRLTARPPAGTN